MVMKVEKAVSALPATLAPDTLYAVRVGAGFDLYFSDATGTNAHKINGGTGSAFLPVPDDLDESDPVYFYFGWADVNGGWLIQRMVRATGASLSATTGAADYASAWAGREGLGYS